MRPPDAGTAPHGHRRGHERHWAMELRRGTNIPTLTGLRGLAALWVVLGHSYWFLPVLQGTAAMETSWFGVDIFFALSGFILCHVHERDFQRLTLAGVRRFLLLRLSRIYPVHLAMLGAALVVYLVWGALDLPRAAARFAPATFVENLLLMQAWGLADVPSWNGVAWSISAEWAAYLVFPLLAFGLLRLRSAMLAFVGAMAAVIAMILVLERLGIDGMMSLQPSDSGMVAPMVARYALVRVAGSFVAGAFCYVVFRSGQAERLPWGAITVGAVAWIIVTLLVLRWDFAALPAVPLLVLGLAFCRGPAAAVAAHPASRFLGEVSYSLYMTHYLVLEIASAPFRYTRLVDYHGPLLYLAYAGALGLIALATLAMHVWVEKPSRIWLRARLASREAPQEAVPGLVF